MGLGVEFRLADRPILSDLSVDDTGRVGQHRRVACSEYQAVGLLEPRSRKPAGWHQRKATHLRAEVGLQI